MHKAQEYEHEQWLTELQSDLLYFFITLYDDSINDLRSHKLRDSGSNAKTIKIKSFCLFVCLSISCWSILPMFLNVSSVLRQLTLNEQKNVFRQMHPKY